MPPLFRPFARSRASAKPPSRSRLVHLLPLTLLAIAVGGTLAAWTGRRDRAAQVTTALQPAAPSTSRPGGRGLARLWQPAAAPRPPLAVPLPTLPQPLPPGEAWPELPLVEGVGFTDIDLNHWAWPMLADLAQRSLVSGFPDGSFRPTEPMTRAEFAAHLARLFDFPLSRELLPAAALPDLGADHWAYASVAKSVQMGFLTVDPEGKFLPDQTVTRIQVIVALANGLMLKSSSGTAPVLAIYSDQDQVPPWARRQLVAATEAGLVVNYPDLGQLAPNQTATRAEVVTMLHRSLVYTGHLQEVPFAYVVKGTW
jgi:hypothetical protein